MNELYRRGQPVVHDKSPAAEGLFSMLPAKLWRRRWLFARVFALVFIPVVAVAVLFPKMYSATGMVIIGERAPQGANNAALLQRLGDPADLEGQILILKSERLLRLVLARPGVLDVVRKDCEYSGMFPTLGSPGSKSAKCQEMVANDGDVMGFVGNKYSIAAVGRSRVISASYVSEVPEVAFIMANSLIMTYLEDQNAANMRDRDAAAAWLKKRGDIAPEIDPLGDLRRDFSNAFFDKVRELEKEPRMLGGSARLLSLAEVPTLPYFPKKVPIVAAALVMASVLATLAALIRDSSDTTVRSRSEVEDRTRLPVLAIVPSVNVLSLTYLLPKSQPGSRGAVLEKLRQVADLLHHPSQESVPFKDACYTLFTKLMAGRSAVAGQPIKKLLVTSNGDGEGKTKTAMALAVVAAARGRRVLLVNCNFGRDGLSASSGEKSAATTFDVLNLQARPEDAVSSSAQRNLYVVCCGASDAGTSARLSERLADFLRWAEQYDLVVIDGTALGEHFSANLFAQLADAVVLCARWGVTRTDDLVAATNDLSTCAVKVAGCVITMAELKELKFYEVTSRPGKTPRLL
jgi:Mrp family chromosome partitioning ATPase